MRRYFKPLAIIGVIIVAVVAISWAAFPDWRNTPQGALLLVSVATIGVLTTLAGLKDALELPFLRKNTNDKANSSSSLTVEGGIHQHGQTNIAAGTVQAEQQQFGGTRVDYAERVVVINPESAPASPPSATQVDITLQLVDAAHLPQLGPRVWLPPTAPRPDRTLVGRATEMDAVRALLQPGAPVAITATVHGTPGVGKTLLAQQLAIELDGQFPGGVLFQLIGSGHRDSELCKPVLNNWAAYAYNGQQLHEGTQLTPDAVRALLDEQPSLLVVLDDVWDIAAIDPLRQALPADACLLITTRNTRIAHELGQAYPLDVLNENDALALLRRRVHNSRDADEPLLTQLAEALGRHAQALDIAAGSLDRRTRNQWPEAVAEMARQVREGSGFGELHLPGDEQAESRVAAALHFSYNDLSAEAQRRFRALGAFAPDASFLSFAVAGVWDCPHDEAEAQLNAFRERGLLNYLEDTERWQQHGLLRAYALALLKREDEEEELRERHAAIHLVMMHSARNRQVYHRILPDYPQLRHAFEWAVEHNIDLAVSLASNTATLQAEFNLVRDGYDWAVHVVAVTRNLDDDKTKGAALMRLGNALYRIAVLPGEDHTERLRDALATCKGALQYRSPDVAPLDYARTQNNIGLILSEIANLPNEDSPARLREALIAYDEALLYRNSDIAPLDYAATQNNRGVILSQLPSLSDEERRTRLYDALAAFNDALQYRHPDVAPFDYAATQNNRGLILGEIAALPGQDRRARLLAALEAYDDVLQYRRPEVAPLDYAMTQGNLANLFSDLATLPEENRLDRLKDAMRCVLTALSLFVQLEHEPYAQQAAGIAQDISQNAGPLFPELWAELKEQLGLGDPPDWLFPQQPTS